MKEILVDEKGYEIKIEQMKTSKKKGIVFNKVLMNITEEQIKENLKSQAINTYFRIQRTDNVTKAKTFTGSIILDFEDEISQYIVISKIKIPVNQMAPKLMMCYHCGLLGHTNARCSKIQVEICPKCYNQHESGSQCRIICKQCKGNHKSTDVNCKVLIKELQILKIKEKYDINYFDAKNIASSMEPNKIMDPLDQARISIQEIKYRNEIMYIHAKKMIDENNNLKNIVKIKDKEIDCLKEAAKREKEEFTEEIKDMAASFKKNQDEYKKILEASEILSKKYEASVDKNEKMRKEKISDSKYIETFINSNDGIVKAFNNYKNNKKNGVLSLELKIRKEPRSTSHRKCKKLSQIQF